MAKSAEVHLARGDASGFLGASKGDPRAFENLEALIFECLSPGNTKEHRIRVALDQLAQACSRSLKVCTHCPHTGPLQFFLLQEHAHPCTSRRLQIRSLHFLQHPPGLLMSASPWQLTDACHSDAGF